MLGTEKLDSHSHLNEILGYHFQFLYLCVKMCEKHNFFTCIQHSTGKETHNIANYILPPNNLAQWQKKKENGRNNVNND